MNTIRPARFVDVPALVDMLVEQQRGSIYSGKVKVDVEYTRKMLAAMVHKHGGIHDGGTCVYVATDGFSEVCGFVVGVLARVYHIGVELMAQDAFLVVGKKAPRSAAIQLIDAYIGWAEASPKVREIQLSHSAAIPGSERISALYRRKGFSPFGHSYRREIALSDISKEAA